MDCRKLKCIALTYDDGPSEYTPQLLKSFTSRKATATLFMLGNAATAHPQIVKQAQLTGERPRLMRPPYAARNSRTDATVGKQGLSMIVWNNSPEDWVAGHDTAATISRLTLERSSRNSIILMHDIPPVDGAGRPGHHRRAAQAGLHAGDGEPAAGQHRAGRGLPAELIELGRGKAWAAS